MEAHEILNPFERLIVWIFSQPREVQEEIAYTVLNFIPGLESPFPDMDTETLPDRLRAWLDGQAEHSFVARTSTILYVRSVVDHFVMRRKESKANWHGSKLWNEQISADLQLEGHSTEFIDKVVQSIPFRQKLWSRPFRDWCALRDGPISNDSLEQWFDSRLDA